MLFERVVQKSQSDEIIDKEILNLALDDEEMGSLPEDSPEKNNPEFGEDFDALDQEA